MTRREERVRSDSRATRQAPLSLSLSRTPEAESSSRAHATHRKSADPHFAVLPSGLSVHATTGRGRRRRRWPVAGSDESAAAMMVTATAAAAAGAAGAREREELRLSTGATALALPRLPPSLPLPSSLPSSPPLLSYPLPLLSSESTRLYSGHQRQAVVHQRQD